MRSGFVLASFLLLVVGGGLLIGYLTLPGAWYAGLVKPPFNPPNAVFGPVWSVLYVLVATAGWRIWNHDRTGRVLALWWLQLGLNFLWSPVFFLVHSIAWALAIVLALLVAVVAFMVAAWRVDRLSAWLFVPYAAWVAFASLLNGSILLLN